LFLKHKKKVLRCSKYKIIKEGERERERERERGSGGLKDLFEFEKKGLIVLEAQLYILKRGAH
jgi:hypothetical protein